MYATLRKKLEPVFSLSLSLFDRGIFVHGRLEAFSPKNITGLSH